MTTADHAEITKQLQDALAIIQRIENKLDALNAEIEKMHIEEKTAREGWRDVIYRIATNLAGLIKPKQTNRPTGDGADAKNAPHKERNI